MSRRGDNIRRRADGRWEGRYRIVSENGEKRYRSIYGKSYGEVKEKLISIAYAEHRPISDYHDRPAAGKEGVPDNINTKICISVISKIFFLTTNLPR